VLFAVANYFFGDPILGYAEGAIVLLLLIYSLFSGRRRKKQVMQYLESVTYDAQTAKNDSLVNFPMPIAAFKLRNSAIVWANSYFLDLIGGTAPLFDARLTDLVPDFKAKWLTEGKQQYQDVIEINDRSYRVYGNIVRGENEAARDFMAITYWVDVTEYDLTEREYSDSRPMVAIIVFDNLDEISRNQPDRVRNEMQSKVADKIESWCMGCGAILCRFDRDKFLFIFETRYFEEFRAGRFSLLDRVHEVISPAGIHASVSIGMGYGGDSFEENYGFARLSVDMALSRGGDQAVLKNRFNFEFFGGRGEEIETRTKVKSRVMANALSELIKVSDQVFIMGHRYGDMDCLGAAAGICCIARKLGCRSYIVLDEHNSGASRLVDRLLTAVEYKDVFISPQEAMLRASKGTLLVVVDTNRPEQTEDQSLLMACNRVAVIDHHRRAATYIENAAFSFVEQYASSVCELLCELMQELIGQPDVLRVEAEALLTGIVMDTKSFTIRTGERTFEAAAFLRRMGADTASVKRILQNGLEDTVAKYRILQEVRRYRDSIAIAAIEEPQDRIVAAQAADEMLNITGIAASIVIYPTLEGGITISARSIGEVNVQVLLEKLGGGGNRSAAGVQLQNIELRDAVNLLFTAIDKYFEE
jgi:c-di-AMP phosphodiesterase-like protein